MSIKDLIAKQRAELETVVEQDVDVVLGGELVTLTFSKALPDEWDTLMATNPPRQGVKGDAAIGYNAKAVSRVYPNVSANGEKLDAETWGELFGVLDSVHRNNVEAVIWGINVNDALVQLVELGKARADQK
ncbi:hypothetical protein [uncultured Microbacterium sp.]|uniref:hypothetical protein n=1 Tax=uncultured Microbacterium sp. TaxID=191216 RepID=UPI0028E46E38|nr:hypothetical protein [uncultured Microbacterium sp.]